MERLRSTKENFVLYKLYQGSRAIIFQTYKGLQGCQGSQGFRLFSLLGLAAHVGLGQSWLSSAAWRTEAASGPSETHTQNAAYSRCEMTDKCSQSFKGCQSQYKVAVNVVNS